MNLPPFSSAKIFQSADSPLHVSPKSAPYPKVDRTKTTDILIVGAGVEGLTLGLKLLEDGHRVVIVERNEGIARNCEQSPELLQLFPSPYSYTYMKQYFGPTKTRLITESHQQAFKWLTGTIGNKSINCDFKLINAFATHNENSNELAEEYKSARKFKIAAKLHKGVQQQPGKILYDFVQYPKQGLIDPSCYCRAIAEHFLTMGGELFVSSVAEDINVNRAIVNGCVITASKIVLTCDPNPFHIYPSVERKNYNQFTLTSKIPKGCLPYGYYKEHLNSDTLKSQMTFHRMHIVPNDTEQDWAITSSLVPDITADREENEQQFSCLAEWARAQFSDAGIAVSRSCTQVKMTSDFLPFAGRCSTDENVYILLTSDSNPVLQSAIGAILLSDLLKGKRNRWKDLYAPLRVNGSEEQQKRDVATKAMEQARNWLDWDILQAIDLQEGGGKIIRNGNRHIALYRDHHGKLHTYDGNCLHDGSPLKWNEDDKTFGCPHNACYSPLEQVPFLPPKNTES